MTDDEKCKHYAGFPKYAAFIVVFDLLESGMNGDNVKLVSVPDAYTGRARRRRLSGTDEVTERLLHLTSAEYLSVGWTSFTFVFQQIQYGQQGNKSIKLCPKPLKTVTLRHVLS